MGVFFWVVSRGYGKHEGIQLTPSKTNPTSAFVMEAMLSSIGAKGTLLRGAIVGHCGWQKDKLVASGRFSSSVGFKNDMFLLVSVRCLVI